MQPADLVAFKTSGPFAVIIKLGQRIGALGLKFPFVAIKALFKGWPAELEWTSYTHIAIVESVDGEDATLLQAVRKINRVLLSSYGDTPHVVIPFPNADFHRADVIDFAEPYIGFSYGILSVVSRGINYLTPKELRVDFSRAGRMECSAYVARAWEHGAGIFPIGTDPWQLTPGDLKHRFVDGAPPLKNITLKETA